MQTDVNFHRDFLLMLAQKIKPEVYLELGIREGFTISKIQPYCGLAVGVDIEHPPDSFDYTFYQCSSETFCQYKIQKYSGKIDLVFIDADHSYVAVKQDFESVLTHVSEKGVVVLHDTYPENKNYLSFDLCGDCWKFPVELLECSQFQVFTFPFPPGLTLISRHLNMSYLEI